MVTLLYEMDKYLVLCIKVTVFDKTTSFKHYPIPPPRRNRPMFPRIMKRTQEIKNLTHTWHIMHGMTIMEEDEDDYELDNFFSSSRESPHMPTTQ